MPCPTITSLLGSERKVFPEDKVGHIAHLLLKLGLLLLPLHQSGSFPAAGGSQEPGDRAVVIYDYTETAGH